MEPTVSSRRSQKLSKQANETFIRDGEEYQGLGSWREKIGEISQSTGLL